MPIAIQKIEATNAKSFALKFIEYVTCQITFSAPYHPNIIQYLGVEKLDGYYFFAFPRMYETICARIHRCETSWDTKFVWIRKIARGIQALHAQNILHCDVKGGHVMVRF